MKENEINQKLILLVDDDPDYLFQTKLMLEELGFKVITAEGQKEAEEILKHTKPDLAILDLMMESDDSGFILSYKLKKTFPEIPVIIATGVTAETGLSFDARTDDDKKWIKADLFIAKGIRPDQLHREINKLLKI